jgi:hypothetical protein
MTEAEVAGGAEVVVEQDHRPALESILASPGERAVAEASLTVVEPEHELAVSQNAQ